MEETILNDLDLKLYGFNIVVEGYDGDIIKVINPLTKDIDYTLDEYKTKILKVTTISLQKSYLPTKKSNLEHVEIDTKLLSDTPKILIPKHMLRSLNLDSVKGKITLRNLDLQNISINGSRENIKIEDVSIENLYLDAVESNVDIRNLHIMHDVSIKTTTGNISINESKLTDGEFITTTGNIRFSNNSIDLNTTKIVMIEERKTRSVGDYNNTKKKILLRTDYGHIQANL